MTKSNMLSVERMAKRKSIKNVEGYEIGNIIDIMIDSEQYVVSYGIVSFKNREGYFAIPWHFFQLSTENNLTLDVDSCLVDKLPVFSEDEWNNWYGSDFQINFDELATKSRLNYPYCNPLAKRRSIMMQQYKETHTFELHR